MTLRPVLTKLWAEDALPENLGDAGSYIPANPSYPDQQPNQYAVGWTVNHPVVKQPHHWMNSWLYSTDWQLMEWYKSNFSWQQEITYVQGAVIIVDGVRYVAQSSNTNKAPLAHPAIWFPAKFHTMLQAQADYAAVALKVNNHVGDNGNPHGETYESFNGMSRADIDAAVQAQDTLAQSHINRRDNPHGLTPADVNVLDKDIGGTFTGQVAMTRMDVSGGGIRRLSQGFEIFLDAGVRLGIDTTKMMAQKDGQEMLSDTNYAAFRLRNSDLFKPPLPDLDMPLGAGLNAYSAPQGCVVDYTSTQTISYTNKSGLASTAAIDEPGFSKYGLQIRAAAGQILSPSNMPTGMVGTVFAIVDDVPTVGIGMLNKSNLLEYFSLALSIRDLKVWAFALTPYQISALGV